MRSNLNEESVRKPSPLVYLAVLVAELGTLSMGCVMGMLIWEMLFFKHGISIFYQGNFDYYNYLILFERLEWTGTG